MSNTFTEQYGEKIARSRCDAIEKFMISLGANIENAHLFHFQQYDKPEMLLVIKEGKTIGKIESRIEYTEENGLRFITECTETK